MKKILFIILVAAISAFTIGCAAQNNTPRGDIESSASDTYAPSPSPSPSPSVSPSPSPSLAANSDPAHYEWGDNMDAVKAIDPSATLGTGGDKLESSTTISNIEMYLQYNFNDSDQLYELEYLSVTKHESAQGYIDDYETLKADITDIFGKPADDSIYKEDARADKVDALTALESGYVTYQTIWKPVDFYKPKDTSIRLVMISTDNKISLGIIFDSIDISGPETSTTDTDSPTPAPEHASLEWGDNMETVKALYPSAVQGTKENTLEAPSKIMTLDALWLYYFNDSDQLYKMVNTSVTTHEDTQGYFDVYKTQKAVCTRVFGEPTDDSIIKKDAQADTVDALTALESGYTIYQTTWDSPDFYIKGTKIKLVLMSTDSGIKIEMFYQSTDITGPET